MDSLFVQRHSWINEVRCSSSHGNLKCYNSYKRTPSATDTSSKIYEFNRVSELPKTQDMQSLLVLLLMENHLLWTTGHYPELQFIGVAVKLNLCH